MNEIVTYGQGYKLIPGIRTFIKSAKRFSDKITVITPGLNQDLETFLLQEKVNIVNANKIAKKHNVLTDLSPYTLKVVYFYLYCKHYSTATNTYLCDLTDVYVQKNVFELIKNAKPYITSENKIIKNCRTNSTWINICYNKDIFTLINSRDILNGGSILGVRSGCIDLLAEMCSDMTQIISRIGNYPNIDQASLNKVVYFDEYRYNILNNFEIANLAHFGDAEIELGNQYITVNQKEPYVVHQYDANKSLEEYLYAQT
jgi:hypothetical protein